MRGFVSRHAALAVALLGLALALAVGATAATKDSGLTHANAVVAKFLKELQGQVKDRNVSLEATEAAIDWLTIEGYKPEFGAREMSRVFHEHIKKPLADHMLFGELVLGGTAVIDRARDADGKPTKGLEITVLKDEKPEAPDEPPPAQKKTLEPA